ncbi:MAG: NAD(P)H-dependent oxidoreductase [Pseudonocardia sp.]|jgi:FMN-dependent NADH-azoreductase|uniref:FMN-dependent NADH-azoreductase n=1 Tax=Pseudonocardia sp. TaxID=60912 RepID=UPI001AD2678B|nr:NAD(P)H-dependent oxidoreductase [Pseudonocardia sp.]MBN9102010.1 NAD(P)H-dependent oxidoreductase [Pseudonocardia sp.]
MTLFRLDSSIRTEGSVTRQVADTLVSSWLGKHPGDTVVRRDLGASPLPADVWPVAATAGYTPEDQRSEQQRSAQALAATLADELIGADAAVIGAPLYNFGLSQHLKTWIDLLITDPRFSPGTTPLAGRPLTLVLARGGGYGAGTPRAGWDHATPYLLQIFRDVFGADVTLVEAELTLADVNPAMADLRDLAATNLANAHEKAAETGRAHAELVAAAAA